MRHIGLKPYRFADNPLEKKFSDAWKRENDQGQMLEWLMGDGNSRGSVTERDEVVAATVIQWLGSPVGKHFLESAMGARMPNIPVGTEP